MTTGHRVSTGGDPRGFAEFTALRDELSKLHHPARPDVDWPRIEQLCLGLFRRNGVELQTAVDFTLARIRLAGLAGLCEGVELIAALVTHQWAVFWPRPTHARVALLAGLSERLQQVWRTFQVDYGDLALLYRAGRGMETICDALRTLELNHLCKLDTLRQTLNNTALRLENTGDDPIREALPPLPDGSKQLPALSPMAGVDTEPLIYIADIKNQGHPRIQVAEAPPPRWKAWQGFVAGISLTALAFGGFMLVQRSAGESFDQILLATTQPLPTALSPRRVNALEQQYSPAKRAQIKPALIQATRGRLEQLAGLSPLWAHHHGDGLLAQARQLWPYSGGINAMSADWHGQRLANATPEEDLANFFLAQTRLEQLGQRLKVLEQSKGRYMTVSALKSAVFEIQQPLLRTPPLEELLRQYHEQTQAGGEPSPILRQQIERRFSQLLNRFALISTHQGIK
ncbi:VasL domain-containing protein [Sodalis sp. dw_96]|uniref:VasL domain-containing protein n=1 Tax=Sodalis sp. dw_96 TaxID=2719794 RepID=UPI001BD276C0|nr:VasL domain-containing protein [Sodalis sp. dw_96]